MVVIKQLKKFYQMGQETVAALAGVDLHIKHNEFVAIMGPSGSGKSTLMNILGCLDKPTSGHYKLDGIELSTLTDDELSAIRNIKIGFVFQTFHLLPRLTALRNVMLPLRYSDIDKQESEQLARESLTQVGLQNRMHHKPFELSGGQRQRVAIARALINKPKVIFADEPTGNLDSKTSEDILALFHQLHQQGQTIVLVTHEEDIAQHAQKIIRLRDGGIEKIEKVTH